MEVGSWGQRKGGEVGRSGSGGGEEQEPGFLAAGKGVEGGVLHSARKPQLLHHAEDSGFARP